MLPREKRLTKNRDFEHVYQRGKRVGGHLFNLSFLPNRADASRIGVVVGKKFSKKAVERNRAKRIFRQAVREIYDSIKPGLDIVLFVKKGDHEPRLESVKSELKRMLEKGGIRK